MSIANRFPDIKPSLLLDFANTKVLDPRITFSRASAGRYYDDHTVAKAEENLLTYSQEFNNVAWNKGANGVSVPVVTPNVALAPDGTMTADQVAFPAVSTGGDWSIIWRPFTAVAGNYAASVYFQGVAGGEELWISYTKNGSTYTQSLCTLTTDWLRFNLISLLTAGLDNIQFGVDLRDGAQSAKPAQTINMWGAQQEQRSSVTAYTPTTTQPITNYIPVLLTAAANECRFHHDPVTRESLGIYVEGAATNLLTYSEDFSNASWGKVLASQPVTVIANAAIGIDGELSASKLVAGTALDCYGLLKSVSVSAGTNTFSLRAKAGEWSRVAVRIYDATAGYTLPIYCTVDLVSGVVLNGVAGTTVKHRGNGVYEISASGTFLTGTAQVIIEVHDSSTVQAVEAGDGYSGIYLMGAQLETGSKATSYIKTEASTVTRAADVATMTGTNFSQWWNPEEGTFVVEFERTAGSVASSILTAARSSTDYYDTFNMRSDTGGGYAQIVVNNLQEAVMTSGDMLYEVPLIAVLSFKTNDCAYILSNGSIVTDTSVTLPSGIDTLRIGRLGDSTFFSFCTIKSIAYYPKRLSNDELQALAA